MPEQEVIFAIPIDFDQAERMSQRRTGYQDRTPFREAADRTLQPLFEGVERNLEELGDEAPQALSRANCITVDGKTVRALMEERYTGPKESFPGWYRDNLRAMTNEIVSAGLRDGKRVEVFVPDSQGNLPKEPAQIIKAGTRPEPIRPATLNPAQRLLSRFGLFKGRAAQDAAYRQITEGRAQVRASEETFQKLAVKGAELRRRAERETWGLQRTRREPSATMVSGEIRPSRFRPAPKSRQPLRNAAARARLQAEAEVQPPKPTLTSRQASALRKEQLQAFRDRQALMQKQRAARAVRVRREAPQAEAQTKAPAAQAKTPAAKLGPAGALHTRPGARPGVRPAARPVSGQRTRRPPAPPQKDQGGRTM